MTLNQYFRHEDSLPNPHGDLLVLNISPGVITVMNQEVMSKISTMSGSGQATGTKKHKLYNK